MLYCICAEILDGRSELFTDKKLSLHKKHANKSNCSFFTMKYLILLLTIAAVQGGEDISKYKPGWMRNPTLVKMHEGDKSGIIGGHEAVPHSHPHQVGLFIDDMYFCGGSLICMLFIGS